MHIWVYAQKETEAMDKNRKMKKENIFCQNELHFSANRSLLPDEIYFHTDTFKILF